ncbi:alpha/beta fold hydrolase [Nannocystis sp. RBIL2]|uniref:alpha/beta hydrolase family protein n=1 Tax=Nannocystis sp. RBIL2 TaxID=2996788 RepID=UPI002270FD7E|nr:alpha/beta fold hydrolase [Nannocystis sp. RBIL2]MCY1065790.1 alpha/beta fold hydrolase [Nannocystis sp. RBIL2]
MRSRPLALATLSLTLASGCLKIPTEASKSPETGSEGQVTLSWPGAAVDKLYRPGEVRVYTMMQSGKPIGTSWGRYEGPVDGEPGHFRFATRIELRPPGRDGKPAEPLRSSGEIVVDARGDLVRGFERSNAAELTFERKGDAIHFSSGRERDEITYRSGDAFMAFSAIFHEELMFGLRRLEVGELAWRLVSLSGSMPTEWTATLTIPDPAAPGRATVKTNLGETIELRDGRIEKIQIEADDVEVQVPVQPPTWPEWAIAGPPVLEYSPPPGAKFTRREVELPGRPGEPALAGEVLLPPGNGPFPGALLLPGTGQQDRFGFAGPPPVDLGSHSITDALAEAGFAVLRFDERGFGSSAEGPVSYLGQLEDARRALRTLLVQDEVDPDRIVLVGHGEGGWKALALAAEDPGVKAVALLATPGRPYEQILRAQGEAALQAVPPQLRDDAKKTQEKTLQALKTGHNVPPELAAQALWVREILQVSPEALIAGGEAPLWIAQGNKDFEVDPNRDPQELMKLAKRRKRKAELKPFADLDHLFKPEPENSNPSRYLDAARTVDRAFLGQLTTWLQGQVKPAAAPAKPRGK